MEIPVDAPGIDSLLKRAFNRESEAALVRALREDGLLTLGVVATDDEGGVIGYASYCPIWIDGEDHQWVALAPLAVDDAWRGQGIGRQLVYKGLDTLNEFGYSAVVTLGDPSWFHRFGFEPAARWQLRTSWPGTEAAFQLFTLADNALDGVSGEVSWPAPFVHPVLRTGH